jgi:hypothetical protein
LWELKKRKKNGTGRIFVEKVAKYFPSLIRHEYKLPRSSKPTKEHELREPHTRIRYKKTFESQWQSLESRKRQASLYIQWILIRITGRFPIKNFGAQKRVSPCNQHGKKNFF